VNWPMVRVEWDDAVTGGKWMDETDRQSIKPFHVFSVGYLYRDDDSGVILFQQTCPEEDKSADFIWIPRGMVVRVQKLRVDGKP
jgi:hypothetical protein